jgi:hypothetical protein
MIKKASALIITLCLSLTPIVHAQQTKQESSTSSTSSATSGSTSASAASGAATAGVSTAVVGAAAAALAVAAALSSSKADPVYTYSNTGQSWGTVTICIKNC